MAPKLTSRTADSGFSNTRATGIRTRQPVAGARGLYLDISVGGKRSWVLRYQIGHGNKRRLRYRRIGDAAVMRLAEAVDRARKLTASLVAGPKEPDRPQATAMTVAELADTFLLDVRAKRKTATAQIYEYHLARFVLPVLGGWLAATVRKADILELLDRIAEQGGQPERGGGKAARREGWSQLPIRVRNIMSAMFGWADKRNFLDGNPALGTGCGSDTRGVSRSALGKTSKQARSSS